MCFTTTTCVNLSLNIFKLFRQKEKKKLSQKRSSCKVFCKMKYLFCKATKLDNLQMWNYSQQYLHSYIVPAKAIVYTFSLKKTHIYWWLNVHLG